MPIFMEIFTYWLLSPQLLATASQWHNGYFCCLRSKKWKLLFVLANFSETSTSIDILCEQKSYQLLSHEFNVLFYWQCNGKPHSNWWATNPTKLPTAQWGSGHIVPRPDPTHHPKWQLDPFTHLEPQCHKFPTGYNGLLHNDPKIQNCPLPWGDQHPNHAAHPWTDWNH